eukprot:TRINITY_DN7659_c0_g1_i3.p1 TRINITY_DN7659_c0_g1~~TRINITY_DN7659_c0_g1_i3.p1  ORF type:complete len:146 (-),score=19.38 TRINITY_DN7659_c0_g1_i3:237-674(-)
MEGIQEISPARLEPQSSKRTGQYRHMSEDKKRDLVFRVMYLNENTRSVCHELGFNFSTGRNLIQRFKKTGEYRSLEKLPPISLHTKSGITKATEGKVKYCSLGLIILSDNQLKLVGSRVYSDAEEESLIRLHEFFVKSGVVCRNI